MTNLPPGFISASDRYRMFVEREALMLYGAGHVCGLCEHWVPQVVGGESGVCVKDGEGCDFACRNGRKCKLFEPRFIVAVDFIPAERVRKVKR